MRPIYIEGNRNGYSPEQCGRTLTVGELIEILESFDPERPVFLRNDRGYTYGSITEEEIEDAEEVSDDLPREDSTAKVDEKKREEA